MSWSRRPNVQDQGDPGSDKDPLADNMRINRPRRSAPTEPLDTERSGSIFDQQTVVDTNFSGRSQERRQRQMSSPFSTQQLGTWAANPDNSRKLYIAGAALLGFLVLLGMISVYNRLGNDTAATDDATGLVTASEEAGAITLDPQGLTSAPADFGAAPQAVPAVPNSDPAQQPAVPAAGTAWVVTGTATEGLFLRRDHVVDPANIIGTLPEGTRVQGLGQEFDDGTRKWQKVQTEQFGEGWAASDFLQPAQ